MTESTTSPMVEIPLVDLTDHVDLPDVIPLPDIPARDVVFGPEPLRASTLPDLPPTPNQVNSHTCFFFFVCCLRATGLATVLRSSHVVVDLFPLLNLRARLVFFFWLCSRDAKCFFLVCLFVSSSVFSREHQVLFFWFVFWYPHGTPSAFFFLVCFPYPHGSIKFFLALFVEHVTFFRSCYYC